MNTTFQTGLAYAKELDTKDELHQYREEFFYSTRRNLYGWKLFRYGF